jgi:dienelactone hydrolase
MEKLPRATLAMREGEVLPYPTYTVRPVSLEVFENFWISGALWLPAGDGPHPGLLVAHGHFGEGKSSGESQAPAHAMAARGWAVLALDTPGVEESNVPGRQIHHAAGAEGRALLRAAGTSAMALQLHGLQAGLDFLERRPDVNRIAVTGASGGAVQSLFLLKIDPRPVAAVLASPVPMPREEGTGGCTCDAIPGWSGPDASFLADLTRPTLWLSELDQPAPVGFPPSATWEVHAGPHGYGAGMIQRAASWLDQQFERPDAGPIPNPIPHTPSTSLVYPEIGTAGLAGLVP